jgi:hypothetical protein
MEVPTEAGIKQLPVHSRPWGNISQAGKPRQQLVEPVEVEPQGGLERPDAAHDNHHVSLVVVPLPPRLPTASALFLYLTVLLRLNPITIVINATP